MDNENFDIESNNVENFDIGLTDKEILELYNDIIESGLRMASCYTYCAPNGTLYYNCQGQSKATGYCK